MTSEPNDAGSRSDKYAIIADDIRELSPDFMDSVTKIMRQLGKSNSRHLYAICKKYLAENGLIISDYGFFGISDKFIGEKVSPCDIVFYATPDKIKTDDIVNFFSIEGNAIEFFHMRTLSFRSNALIEVQDLGSKETYVISRDQILGRLLKVINFNEPEWHDLIMEMVDKQWIIDTLKSAIDVFEGNTKYVEELEKRLAVVMSGTV